MQHRNQAVSKTRERTQLGRKYSGLFIITCIYFHIFSIQVTHKGRKLHLENLLDSLMTDPILWM